MNKVKDYFKFSDAWVFTSLFMYDSKFKKIELVNIIAYGDALNHSIFEIKELQFAFEKLLKVNLIEINNNSLKLTDLGCEVKEKVTNDIGGFFERVDKVLKRINVIEKVNDASDLSSTYNFEFLNEDKFEIAFKSYKKITNPVNKKYYF